MYKKIISFIIILLLANIKMVSAGELLTRLKNPVNAPALKLKDMDETVHDLADYTGKPVIINFWASWCPPCREELPSMNSAWDKLKHEGIIMLAVNVGEDEDTIFSFMGNYPIDFTVLLDQTGEVSEHWPIKGLPTTFVLNSEGYIIYQAIGGRAWDDKKLLDTVRSLKHTN